jgi:hypothetical protein
MEVNAQQQALATLPRGGGKRPCHVENVRATVLLGASAASPRLCSIRLPTDKQE